jgi:hypothetical protein
MESTQDRRRTVRAPQSGDLPGNSTVFRERDQTTDKCRRDRHRKLIRFSARTFAHRIAVRFAGIGPQAVRADPTPGNRRQNSNVFSDVTCIKPIRQQRRKRHVVTVLGGRQGGRAAPDCQQSQLRSAFPACEGPPSDGAGSIKLSYGQRFRRHCNHARGAEGCAAESPSGWVDSSREGQG